MDELKISNSFKPSGGKTVELLRRKEQINAGMNLHIFERCSALQTVSYEQENFPSVYCKQNNNGQWLKLRGFFPSGLI